MKEYRYSETFTFEGKRYRVRADSKRELAEKVALRKHELEAGTKRLKPSVLTVEQWAELCFEQYKTNIEPITLQSQKTRASKHIFPEVGHLRLKDVKPIHVQKIMNNMQGLANDTIRKVYQLMNFFFDKAVQNEIIRTNPCSNITIPKGKKPQKRRAITPEERKHVLKVAEEDKRFVFYLFMLFCGCRPSEVANIRACDIKSVNGINLLHIRGTKTENAVRDVPIPDYLIERIPETDSPFDYLFTNSVGGKLSISNMNRLGKAFKRALNISMGCQVYRNELVPPFPLAPDFVPYDLRHTYCTDLQKQGIDIRTAQHLMGHSTITLTADVYSHMDDETLSEVAKKLQNNGQNVTPSVTPEAETVENTMFA